MTETVVLAAGLPDAIRYLPLITGKGGVLRASKPKGNGNAAYVWRMVAFSLSTNPKQHCMPVTADWDVTVPEDYLPEPPQDWLDAHVARSNEPINQDFIRRQEMSAEDYARKVWKTFRTNGRVQHYIKNVLDPIVKDIVDAVPVRKQAGSMRWARALGYV